MQIPIQHAAFKSKHLEAPLTWKGSADGGAVSHNRRVEIGILARE
jgi:hypothetical protein